MQSEVSYQTIRVLSNDGSEPNRIAFLCSDDIDTINLDELIEDAIKAFDLQVDLWDETKQKTKPAQPTKHAKHATNPTTNPHGTGTKS